MVGDEWLGRIAAVPTASLPLRSSCLCTPHDGMVGSGRGDGREVGSMRQGGVRGWLVLSRQHSCVLGLDQCWAEWRLRRFRRRSFVQIQRFKVDRPGASGIQAPVSSGIRLRRQSFRTPAGSHWFRSHSTNRRATSPGARIISGEVAFGASSLAKIAPWRPRGGRSMVSSTISFPSTNSAIALSLS